MKEQWLITEEELEQFKKWDEMPDYLYKMISTIEAQAEKVTELDDLATEQAEIIRNKSKKIADQAKELERVKEDARQRMLMIEELGSKLTAAEEELEQTRDARDKALSKMASFEEMYEDEHKVVEQLREQLNKIEHEWREGTVNSLEQLLWNLFNEQKTSVSLLQGKEQKEVNKHGV